MAIFSSFFTFFKKNKPRYNADAIVLGIGNYGEKYENTRHNVGFVIVDFLAKKYGVPVTGFSLDKNLFANVALIHVCDKNILLVKPVTFVNKSGDALQACANIYNVSVDQCLVVVDDYNLALGTVRFRKNGSDGGHNGLKSLIQNMGPDFPRVRIGIGPKDPGTDTIDFVLGKFLPEQQEKILPVMDTVITGIELFLEKGIESAMSACNNKK